MPGHNHPFNPDTMLIVVSDVHLGGVFFNYDAFTGFLQSIKSFLAENKTFRKTLKGLIILGDFFDLLMDTYARVADSFPEIYRLLSELQQEGIQIVFALGNHEISVVGNYHAGFRKRKIKMMRAFQNESFTPIFLKDGNICQYLVLRLTKKREWALGLYETNEITSTPFGSILLGKASGKKGLIRGKEWQCLMAHGYQFDKVQTQAFGLLLWNGLLDAKIEVKESVNRFYHDTNVRDLVSKGKATEGKIKDAFKKWASKNLEKSKWWQQIKMIKQEIIRNTMLSMLKIDSQRKKMININEKLYRFLQKSPFQEITHVIYGHTHKPETSTVEGIEVTNTGSWAHDHTPSFVEITTNGVINLREWID